MTFRQLKEEKYAYFVQQLIKKGRQEPLDPSFSVTMKIDDREYILKIQPENKSKLFILQALRVERESYGHDFTLITDNNFLLSLLNILIYQGIK